MNKKAFTLIELLAIILLLGIIIGIAVGSYSLYLNNSKNKAFKIAESNFITATRDAYADCVSNNPDNDFCSNHKELNTEYQYELISLEELVNDNYIEKIKNPYDTEQFCDISKSYVYVSSKKNTEESNNSDIIYKACLICGDHKSSDCLDEDLDYSTFGTTCLAYYDSIGGEIYDGEWTDRDIYLNFGASGNYRYGIDYFKYTSNGNTTKIVANRNSNTATLLLNKSINNYEYTVQAFDGMSGKGTLVSCGKNIKIDKGTINSVSITGKNQSGTTVSSDKWSDSNVTLTVSVNPSTSVSGYLYQWYKDGVKYGSQTSSNTLTVSAKGTYKVEVTNQVGKIVKTSNEFIVKVDTKEPTCTLTATGEKYNDIYIGDVTISFSNVEDKENELYDGSGIKTQTIDISTITTDVSKQIVTGTVVDNVGRTNTCTIEITRDAKTPTVVATQETNYITTTTNKNISDYFLDSFGLSGGTTICKIGSTVVTNTNDLSLGVNTVTCTSTGNNGKTDTASTVFRHQYAATAQCSSGTLTGGQCQISYSICTGYKCTGYNSCSSCKITGCASWNGWIDSTCYSDMTICENNRPSNNASNQWACVADKNGCGGQLIIKYCGQYSYASCEACGCGTYDYNTCVSWGTSTKVDNSYRSYTCPTTGINGNTNATVSPTLSGSTCSF